MSDSSSDKILSIVDRFRAGDPLAGDELLRSVRTRLEELSRRMLAGFPRVQRTVDADDILQGASIRLLNSLRDLRPETARDFFRLASMQIRRELLDLARRVSGNRIPGQSEESPEPFDSAPANDELDLWSRFHEHVEKLPVMEREAIGLVFYHGKTRGEAAEILNVSERTVHRWWQSACERLKDRLGGELPLA